MTNIQLRCFINICDTDTPFYDFMGQMGGRESLFGLRLGLLIIYFVLYLNTKIIWKCR